MNHVQNGKSWALMCSRRSLDLWAALNVVIGSIVNVFCLFVYDCTCYFLPCFILSAHDLRGKNKAKRGRRRSKGGLGEIGGVEMGGRE